VATTGHSFILGKINSANKQTTLTRTTLGPALKLNTKSANNAPLVLNGKGRVANLNADKVDGLDSTQLATKHDGLRQVATRRPSTTFSPKWEVPVTAGDYTFSYSIGIVPSSTAGDGDVQNMGSTGPQLRLRNGPYVAGAPRTCRV